MATQTTTSLRTAYGFPGMISDASRDTNFKSYTNEHATAEIPFGVFVAQGVNTEGMLPLAAITDDIIGFHVHSSALAKDVEVGETGLKRYATGSIATRCRVWARVEGSVTPASPVHIRAVATGAEVAGAVRGAADGTDTIDASRWARFLGDDVNGIVELEFDINNRNAV